MTMFKMAPIRVKAGPDDGLQEGQFTAYASTFTRDPDSYGDVVAKGAFTNTLAEWAESGNTIPVLYGHRMDDPDFNVGGVVEAAEDDHGLLITGQLDLDNPKAAQVYRLLKGRRVSQMSFAFDVIDSDTIEEGGERIHELREVRLYEVSIVPIGANQDTEILDVKARADSLAKGLKAGRVLAQKHIDSLRSAWESIGAVLEAADASQENEGKASARPVMQDEEPAGAKSEASPADASAQALALEIQLLGLM